MPYTPNFMEFSNPAFWTGFVRDLPIPEDYIGGNWFPVRQVPAYNLTWDFISTESPLAPFVAPGVESPLIDRDQQIKRYWARVAFMRYKAVLDEEDISWLRAFGDDPNAPVVAGNMARAARSEMARVAEKLRRSVDARMEWMGISSMLGALVVTPTQAENVGKSAVSFTVPYPVRTVTATPLWSDHVNADPILDLATWSYDPNNTFRRPTTMIMSTPVLFDLQQNQKLLRTGFLQQGATAAQLPAVMSPDQTLQIFRSAYGLNIVVYDARYTTRTYTGATWVRNLVRFLPARSVILLPGSPIGYFADAPVPPNNWQSGMFAWTVTPEDSGRIDPWIHEMGVMRHGIPIMERPQDVLVATV